MEGQRRWPRVEDMSVDDIWTGPTTAEVVRELGASYPPRPSFAELARWQADGRTRCLTEAEDLLNHRFSFFALDREPLGPEIDWNRDYSTAKAVSLESAHRLNYRDPDEVGDVKYVWELGRMQHLVRLAQAWRHTADERFPREAVRQIMDFIRQCPYMRGVQWTSPMEAGLRLISWTWVVHLLADWEGLEERFLGLLVRSIHQHLCFINRSYSLFSSAHNHLIAEASGVYFAASYWRPLQRANGWRQRAKAHLLRECLRQNYSDGVNKEQAFAYQFFVWDLLLIAALMGRATGDEFPAAYWHRLECMAEFLAWVSDCGQNTPGVGDADDGVAIDLGGDRWRPIISLMKTVAAVWRRDDFKAWAGDSLDEKTAWLLGAAGYERYAAPGGGAASVSQRGNRSFLEGGYVVLRHGSMTDHEVLLVFDAGPLGWPSTAGHGHADALSILLHLSGQPVFIDPGTFSYQNTPRRRYFRATAQHNTLCFGQRDQAQYLNRFMWGKRPKVVLLRADIENTPQVLEGEVLWWDGAKHRRKIEFLPQSSNVQIEDTWEGPEPPMIRFCLAPDVSAVLSGPTCAVDTATARLTIQNDSASMELETAEVSPHCYHLQQTHRMALCPAEAAGHSVTVISWEFK